VKRILLLPFSLLLLSSCSIVDNYKSELKEELKNELKLEITSDLKNEFDKNEQFKLKIKDNSLLGISEFEAEQTKYSCSFSGRFKFNIEVPINFSGWIYDPLAIYTFKGKEKIGVFNEEFFEGRSISGVYVSEYISSEEKNTEEGALVCSISSSDDIKLKSFSKKVLLFPAIIPELN
tara:strand:+ start:175 stop:705 length:531 start_codon:yes stop_codon:yes gene_type:complete